MEQEQPTLFFGTRIRQEGMGTLNIIRNPINGNIEFEVHDDEEFNTIVKGTFANLFELILLGKLYKEWLSSIDKREPAELLIGLIDSSMRVNKAQA